MRHEFNTKKSQLRFTIPPSYPEGVMNKTERLHCAKCLLDP